MMANVLSVDWDYFFSMPNGGKDIFLFDWGHREAPFFYSNVIWDLRAAAFSRAGRPLPQVSDEWRTFWPRFTIAEGAPLFVSESHVDIMDALEQVKPVELIVNFDAHHDCYGDAAKYLGAGSIKLDCSDWFGYVSNMGIECLQRYPAWRDWQKMEPDHPFDVDMATDDGRPFRDAIDAVFVCRSGAWVPPWCDEAFNEFVAACPADKLVVLRELHERRPSASAIVDREVEVL